MQYLISSYVEKEMEMMTFKHALKTVFADQQLDRWENEGGATNPSKGNAISAIQQGELASKHKLFGLREPFLMSKGRK